LASPNRILTWLSVSLSSAMAADLKPADLEFFESKIRPVLVAECYECPSACRNIRHTADTIMNLQSFIALYF
jgi:hypothetical protein